MPLKVRMFPHPTELPNHASGIAQVVLNYAKHLPAFGVDIVDPSATSYDLEVGHAAAKPGARVHHSHGLLWTAEKPYSEAGHETNRDLVRAIRMAKQVTVPSAWVAETFKRDMHFTPHVVWHGVNWEDWQHKRENLGYVLWGKNRTTDFLDPRAIYSIARAFPDVEFVTTWGTAGAPDNVSVLGSAIPFEEMQILIQSAAVVLATDKETWGILPAEAMAAGVPVLTIDSGAVPDFVEHGVSGYCFQPRNVQDAIEGLRFCLKYRDQLGQNGREQARQLTWERAAQQVAQIYADALEEEEPTVAVVIPTYNYGHVLQGAIESVVHQSYQRITDIVIVDDGSTDDTTRTVAAYWASRDRRINYLRQDNHGVGRARNAGADSSNSTYLVFLDADDRIEPQFIERLIPALELDRTCGIAYTGVRVPLPDSKEAMPTDWLGALEPHQFRSDRNWPTTFDYQKQLNRENQVPSCCLIRRTAFERVGGYRSRYCPEGAGSEDAELFLRLGANGWGATYVSPSPDGLWVHTHGEGYVSAKEGYDEPDWTAWHPWTRDGQHPFASIARPENGLAHPIRSYDRPLVSVIIPVGPGHEENVMDALDSLEAQTFRYWEAIVIDDTGDTRLKEILTTYPYVQVVNLHGSQGAGIARNRGVDIARAPLLLFLDADDYLIGGFLEKATEAFTQTGNIIYTDFMSRMTPEQQQTYGGEIIKTIGQNVLVLDRFDDYDCQRARQRPEGNRPYVHAPITILLPKIWHDAIGGFDESMATWEDCDYLLRLSWDGRCYTRIPEPLWSYNFVSGQRRQHSYGQESELVAYLQQKYDQLQVNPMGCNCGGPKNLTPAGYAIENTSEVTALPVIYQRARGAQGRHLVKGRATLDVIGYLRTGDRATVKKVDLMKAQGLWLCANCGGPLSHTATDVFCSRCHRPGSAPARAAQPESGVTLPEIMPKRQAPPTPPDVSRPREKVTGPLEIKRRFVTKPLEVVDKTISDTALTDPLDVEITWHLFKKPINSHHIRLLKQAGIHTLSDIKMKGPDRLVEIKGIGRKVAETLWNGVFEPQQRGIEEED